MIIYKTPISCVKEHANGRGIRETDVGGHSRDLWYIDSTASLKYDYGLWVTLLGIYSNLARGTLLYALRLCYA